MTVTLRQRKKGDKISLYLDYYSDGKRDYEYLQLYLIPEPEKGRLSRVQKEHNRKTMSLAEAIRSKRLLQVKNEEYGFRDTDKAKGSFIAYFEKLTEKRKGSKGNWGNWDSVLKHLRKFARNGASFKDINKNWLENFKTYLTSEARTKNNKPLAQNSQSSYFSKVAAALKEAVKDGIILTNPANLVKGISTEDPHREFLTLEELQAAAKEECKKPIMKTVFFFSALTGLRWSEIEKLVWSEVQHSEQTGYYIRFRQKKTKGAETLPISEQAVSLLGERRGKDDKVFVGLTYNNRLNIMIREWLTKAGITKHITFHSARHSFATLQLAMDTDIYTLSKMLGHKNLKTTEIYAKVIDKRKIIAANKLKI